MGESVTVKWKKQETLRLRFCFLYAAVSSPSSFTLKTNTISTSVANSYYPGKNTEMPPVDIKTAVNVFICKRRQTVSDCLRCAAGTSVHQMHEDRCWTSKQSLQALTAHQQQFFDESQRHVFHCRLFLHCFICMSLHLGLLNYLVFSI